MALCVAVNADGTLSQTGQPVDQCTGYVMVSGSEYGVYQVLQDALAAPTPEQALGWFFGVWGVVVVSYITARFTGTVISMFK